MDNRPNFPIKEPSSCLALHLDHDVLAKLTEANVPIENLNLVPPKEARAAITKKDGCLLVSYGDGDFCTYPFYLNNILLILKGLRLDLTPSEPDAEAFASVKRAGQTIEKRLFSNVQAVPGQNIKDLWDEIIKKINSISKESHSLGSLIEKLLDMPFLQNYESSLVVLHLKGQIKASIIGTVWRGEKYNGLIEVKDFNSFFNSVKKGKIKSFTTDSFLRLDLPFNGCFLATEVVSKKYSMVAMASRNDFLSYNQDEIELFETCIDLLQPHFERLVDQEFSDKHVSELRVCLNDFPIPLRIRDSGSGTLFFNDLYQNELQDKDIFFSKKMKTSFTLDLYDCDELRHYAFDLFHFQRISLLGDLLNTLRHELSNPLFGLTLGSQIFNSIEAPSESKEIMKEIEKNVHRCQVIIENFSSLYQFQNETRPVTIKKILDEALILSKSEVRGMSISVDYSEANQDLLLEVPLIFVVQIIFNLIVNASQALKTIELTGEIKLKVKEQDSVLLVDVQDNGPGIPDHLIGSLFKPFFTTKPQGTGLGLVLSRNLALKIGGNLEYLINNGFKGALFRLTLPVS